MSLGDIVYSLIEVLGPLVPILALEFIFVCMVLAIFVGLIVLAFGRT